MSLSDRLRNRAKSLKKQLTAVYYAYQDPGVTLLPKLIIGLAIGYALSPVDLIPDFIPVLGMLDDFIIVPALITLAISLIPKEVMEEARIKAESKPISLKKNWIFGTIFITIWILLLAYILFAIFSLVG